MTTPSSERRRIDSALEQVRALRRAGQRDPPPPPPAFPGYEILSEIHRGGQGVVYHAIQETTGQEVAIKVLRELSSSARVRFEREVAVLARLRHRNLVAIHDCGVSDGRFFYVMDFVPGRDLDRELAGGGRSLREEVELLSRVSEAVGAAHLRGVLHRDLKPSNIRIDPEGEPRLLDFGLAKWLHEEEGGIAATTSGGFIGSAPWASPEQVEGRAVDVRSDVYSLGVLAFQALTGSFPYDVGGSLARVFESIRTAAPARPRRLRPEIDADLETCLLTALAKEPERRYQSALELARDLRNWLAGRPIDAKRHSGFYVLRKTLRHHWLATAVACGVLALLTVAAVAVGISRARWRDTAGRLDALLKARELQRIAAAFHDGDAGLVEELLAAVPAQRRDWAHAHFRERLGRRRWRFAPPAERVVAAALAPLGPGLVAGSWEGRLRMLDEQSGALLWESAEPLADVRAVAFHPGGASVVAAGSDGIHVFAAANGEHERTLEVPSGGLEVLSVSEGTILAASAAGQVFLFDFATGEPLRSLACAHPAPSGSGARHAELSGVACTALHAGAGRIATAGRDLVRIWDVQSNDALLSVPVLAGLSDVPIAALAFSGDASRVAVATNETGEAPGVLLVFDAHTGARITGLEDLARTSSALVLDDQRCLVGSSDGVVRWFEGAREEERLPGRGQRIQSLAWASESSQLAVLDGGLTLWDLGQERTALGRPREPLALAIDARGRRWCAGLDALERIELWRGEEQVALVDAPRGRPLALALGPDALVLAALWPGGAVQGLFVDGREPVRWELGLSLQALAIAGGELWSASKTGEVFRLDLGSGGSRVVAQVRERVDALALDDERVALATRTGIALLDRRTGATLAAIAPPAREEIGALAFLAGENLLAAGSADGRIWILDLEYGDPLCALPAHSGAVQALAFDRGRGELLSAGEDGRIRVQRGAPR